MEIILREMQVIVKICLEFAKNSWRFIIFDSIACRINETREMPFHIILNDTLKPFSPY